MKWIQHTILVLMLGLIPGLGWAQSIGVSVPDTTGLEGDTLLYPVYVDSSVTGEGIISYELELSFDEFYIEALGIENAGTMSDGYTMSANTDATGRVSIAGAGSSELQGTGVLVFIEFRLKQPVSSRTISFTGSSNNFFNEGTPEMVTSDGTIEITALPSITVSPNSSNPLTVDDSLQFSVSGGTAPFSWSLTNPPVGSIDETGTFKAESAGFTRIVAEDSAGIIDTTDGRFEVRAFKFLEQDTAIFQKQELVYPVEVSDLSGLGILSGSFEFEYNKSVLHFQGIETNGTLLEGVEVSSEEFSEGVRVAFSSANEITGKGLLINLRFTGDDQNSGWARPSFRNIEFNEDLAGNAERQFIDVKQLPELNVSISANEMLAEESQQLTVTNNTGPVSWNVSDTSSAAIDENGVLTAIKGGSVTATATDSIGSQGTSSVIQLYDLLIDLADTTAFEGDTLLFPVHLENASQERGFISIEMDLTYDPNLLEIAGVTTTGSLTEGWSFSLNTPETNRVNIAGAGTGQVTADGELFYLDIVVKKPSSNDQFTGVNIENGSLMLDEGAPVAKGQDGGVTITTTPFKVALLDPANDSTNTPTSLNFTWKDTRGADEYQLQIATDESFSTIFKDTTGLTTTQVDISGLEHDTQYYWRVRGSNDTGSGEWSDPFTFTTIVAPPDPPVLLSPGNNTSNADTSVAFSWEESQEVDRYRFQFSKESDFTTVAVDSSLNSAGLSLSGLDFSTTYYWRVKGSNAGGESDWSQVFSFTTFDGLPGIVNLLEPQDGAVGVDLSINLVWNAAELAESYELQLSTANDFSSFVVDSTSMSDTTVSVSLDSETVYYWRVRALNQQGTSPDWSDTSRFTSNLSAPAAATLVPADGATEIQLGASVSVTFDQSVSEVDLSGITIEDSGNNPAGNVNASLSDSTIHVAHDDFVAGETYTVSIPAGAVENADGVGNEPFSWSFTALSQGPAIASLEPVDGSVGVAADASLSVTFDQSVSEVDLSGITIDDSDGNPAGNVAATLSDSTVNIGHDVFANGETYTVSIPAGAVENTGGIGNEAFSWSFTIILAAPDVSSLEPVDGTSGVSLVAAILANFDQAVIAADLSGIDITDSQGTSAGSVSASLVDSTINVSHDDFNNGETYTVIIPAGSVENSDGVGNEEISWSFTTILPAPISDSVVPANGAEAVALDAAVSATFEQTVSETDLTGITIEDSRGQPVAGISASLTDSTISITHEEFKHFTDYTVTVPSNAVQNADGIGNEAFSWGFTTLIPPKVAADAAVTFGDAAGPQDYRLVALPGAVDEPLGGVLSGRHEVDWQAWWDDGTAQDYLVEYDGSDTFALRPGRGFWVTSRQAFQYADTLQMVTLDSQNRASVPLHDGWNIISNPLDIDVDWSAVEAANGATLQPVWGFDGSFTSRSVFPSASAGQAFYFLNDQGFDELKIPYQQAAQESTPAEERREFRITALIEGQVTSTGRVVFDEGNRPDIVAPSVGFERATLLFAPEDRPDQPPERTGRLARLYREYDINGQHFPMILEATPGRQVRIRAEALNLAGAPAVKLIERKTGRRHDLTGTSDVVLTPEKEETKLTLAVGKAGYVDRLQQQYLPSKVEMMPNYPNPFNPSTTIRFSLPEQSKVRLQVYNLLGRRVATLVNEVREAGTHTVQFDASRHASGTYFGVMEIGGQRFVQKMLLIK